MSKDCVLELIVHGIHKLNVLQPDLLLMLVTGTVSIIVSTVQPPRLFFYFPFIFYEN
jgi:hypothetical protein